MGDVVCKGPQKVLKIRTKLTERIANQGSESQALVKVVGVVFSSLLVLYRGEVVKMKECEESKV